MLHEQDRFFVLKSFSYLEEQLADCMEIIPPIHENMDMVSHRFVPIIVEACALWDSIKSDYFGRKNGEVNHKHGKIIIETELELSENMSIFLVSPPHLLFPHKDMQTQTPHWWNAYNLLKHDRIGNYRYATMSNAIDALAALHQLIARSNSFRNILFSTNWIKLPGDFRDMFSHIERITEGEYDPIYIVESRLFASLTSENFSRIQYYYTEYPRNDINNINELSLYLIQTSDVLFGWSDRLRQVLLTHDLTRYRPT